MPHRPENSEPIRSAGHIEDPDQPVEMHGKDQGHAKDHGHRHHWRRGQKGATAESAREGGVEHDAPTEDTLAGTQEHGAGSREHPRKALKETGFPNVDPAEVEALQERDIDTGPLATVRKFQPPAGRPNPNVTQTPNSGRDYEPGEVEEQEDSETYGTPENTPPPEPVRHSRVVEERIRQQEHDYDLEETAEGERYVTPHED